MVCEWCMVFGLLYGMWVAGYKGCSICGLLNGKCDVVWYVVCSKGCGLLYGM